MPKHVFSRIMLLAEGTEEGMQAARVAIELAADEEARLFVVSVVDTNALKQLLTYRIFVEEEMKEYEQEIQASSRKQLDYVAQLADKRKVKHETALLTGAAHTAVLEHQRRCQADVFVMGAFRATTFRSDLLAREKQLLLDELTCPVLLVPAEGQRR
jgi:nucleotide-binding universal stress UspA family protein